MNNQNENYILILKESLEKKKHILETLLDLNERQKNAVSGVNFDAEMFEEVVEEKERYIEQIEELDRGFQSVYDHVKEALNGNRERYKTEIGELKRLIAEVTEKSMEMQISEKRNEQLVYSKIAQERKKIHQSRTASRVASDYYKSMSKVNVIDPQFLDKKK